MLNSIIPHSKIKKIKSIGRCIGPSMALAIYQIAITKNNPVLVLAEDTQHGEQLKNEISFFNLNAGIAKTNPTTKRTEITIKTIATILFNHLINFSCYFFIIFNLCDIFNLFSN